MKNARVIGNYVQHLAKKNDISVSELSKNLNCEENQIKLFFKGRAIASYQQLQKLSELFNVPIKNLMQGDEQIYNQSVVHCMNEFSDNENREFILDIIDDYMDIKDSLQ